jgi:hypothetical protein
MELKRPLLFKHTNPPNLFVIIGAGFHVKLKHTPITASISGLIVEI